MIHAESLNSFTSDGQKLFSDEYSMLYLLHYVMFKKVYFTRKTHVNCNYYGGPLE